MASKLLLLSQRLYNCTLSTMQLSPTNSTVSMLLICLLHACTFLTLSKWCVTMLPTRVSTKMFCYDRSNQSIRLTISTVSHLTRRHITEQRHHAVTLTARHLTHSIKSGITRRRHEARHLITRWRCRQTQNDTKNSLIPAEWLLCQFTTRRGICHRQIQLHATNTCITCTLKSQTGNAQILNLIERTSP